MHRDQGSGARRQLALGVFQVERGRLGIDVDENGHVVEKAQRQTGGDEGVGRHHDLAARGEIQRKVHAGQSAGTIDVCLHERRLGVGLPFRFKQRQFLVKLVIIKQVAYGLLLGVAVTRPACQGGLLGFGARDGLAPSRER